MKQKPVYQSFKFISIILMIVGFVFIGIAILMQVIPIGPENFNMTVNGVRQPYNEENVRGFRLLFLAIFGIIGAIPFGIGLFMQLRQSSEKKRIAELKERGTCLWASNGQFEGTNVTVNNRQQMRLTFSATDEQGNHYVFKTPMLRYDPSPYMVSDQVKVYYDPNNMKNYFVAIEESMKNVYSM